MPKTKIKRRLNPNHPKKGSQIRVEPIHKLEDIQAIKDLLKDHPRNSLLFIAGINNGLRGGDLLNLKVGQVSDLHPGEYTIIKEQKTGKENKFHVNEKTFIAIHTYLGHAKPSEDDWLFPNEHHPDKHLSVIALNLLMKKWTKAIGVKGNYGGHTLRKTFGYVQRVFNKADWPVLARRFNHQSQKQTMDYLGIEDEEINDLMQFEI